MRKRYLLSFALFMSVLWSAGFTGGALADDCDPAFKNIEVYLAKTGRYTYKAGLKEKSEFAFFDVKRLKVEGCTVEPVETMRDGQVIFIIGPKALKDKSQAYQFQTSTEDYRNGPGIKERDARFEYYAHPDYRPEKNPGMYHEDRGEIYKKALDKQGKAIFKNLLVSQPYNDSFNAYKTQDSQYYNAKTGKVFLKFSCKINPYQSEEQAKQETTSEPGESKKDEAAPAQQQEDSSPKGLLKKGLKGLFD